MPPSPHAYEECITTPTIAPTATHTPTTTKPTSRIPRTHAFKPKPNPPPTSTTTTANAQTPSRLLSLAPEILLLILTHLFHLTHLIITAHPTTGTLTIESEPPLKPLLLTCRALRREAPLVARTGVRGVVWDFDYRGGADGRGKAMAEGGEASGVWALKGGWPWISGGGGGGGAMLGVQSIKELLPIGAMRGVRAVEVCVPPVKGLCGGCLVRWLEELVYLGPRAERVLVRVGVKRVRVGEWARLVDAVGRGDGLVEMLGCWSALSGLVRVVDGAGSQKRKMEVLVELAFMCDVRMACLGQGEDCGVGCFGDNFMYCVVDTESMKVLESRMQRCARTIVAQEVHQTHAKYMAATRRTEITV